MLKYKQLTVKSTYTQTNIIMCNIWLHLWQSVNFNVKSNFKFITETIKSMFSLCIFYTVIYTIYIYVNSVDMCSTEASEWCMPKWFEGVEEVNCEEEDSFYDNDAQLMP